MTEENAGEVLLHGESGGVRQLRRGGLRDGDLRAAPQQAAASSELLAEEYRFLMLDDVVADAELAERQLRKAGIPFALKLVETRETFLAALEDFSPDLILLDYELHQFDGWSALRLAQKRVPDVPVVMFTGSLNEERAVACLNAGAADYVLKTNVLRLAPAVERALEGARAQVEKQQAEEALHESEERFRALVESANDAVVVTDATGKITVWNSGAAAMFGYSSDEIVGRPVADLMPERYRDAHVAGLERVGAGGEHRSVGTKPLELEGLRKDGSEFPIESSLTMWRSQGEPFYSSIMRDITERREAFRALEQLSHWHETILTSAGEGIMGLGLDGNITFVNAAGGQILGTSPGELLGRQALEVFHNSTEDGAQISVDENSFLNVVRNGETRSAETVFRQGDDRSVSVYYSTSPIREEGRIVGSVIVFEDITERKQAEEALRRSEAAYRGLVENATYGMFRSTPKEGFISVNPALVRMLGYDSEEDLLALDLERDLYENPSARRRLMEQSRDSERVENVERRWRRKDGGLITVRLNGKVIADQEGRTESFEMIVEDVSVRRQLEEQLRHAQKMEAVGQLTGGIAHDFNNMLSVVLLNTQLIMGAVDSGEPVERSDVAGIEDAVRRASAMTRQLLGFGRRAELKPVPTDIACVTGELSSMLRTLLPESIEVSIRADEPVGAVEVDPSSVEQMLLNLATNAGDAMPDGGTLELEVSAVELDGEYTAERPYLAPGAYVRVSVTDTGVGMDEETRNRIFEPFFTTKDPGKGTGLGMAMVYGLMKQQGGNVHVYSEPREGTTVPLDFPTVRAAALPSSGRKREVGVGGGTEMILLVEDEKALRRTGRRALEGYGYTVLDAANGEEALEVYRAHAEEIDLVISDLVMPKMSGSELYETLQAEEKPPRSFILASGYTGRDMRDARTVPDSVPFLQKPWDLSELLARVREVLDGC